MPSRHCTAFARAAALALGCSLLVSCADYRFTVNDKVLYRPDELFTAYDIEDKGLRDCVRQHVSDASITAAGQLEELNCSHAGISDLQGIQVFTGLARLKLSSNAISNLAPLSKLQRLSELQLDGNKISSLSPIRALPALNYLNVEGNAKLNCTELENLSETRGLKLAYPQQCK